MRKKQIQDIKNGDMYGTKGTEWMKWQVQQVVSFVVTASFLENFLIHIRYIRIL